MIGFSILVHEYKPQQLGYRRSKQIGKMLFYFFRVYWWRFTGLKPTVLITSSTVADKGGVFGMGGGGPSGYNTECMSVDQRD